MSPVPAADEVRVHGVGGPQAAKILGVIDETDTEVLAPPALPSPAEPAEPAGDGAPAHLFSDSKSRVVGRIGDPAVVAYEWGGLTLGSLTNALWVAYLPLTVLNVAGWSQRPGAGRGNRAVAHVLCGLGTLTYVGWLGYVLLDLVGRQWRDRLVAADLPSVLEGPVRWGGLSFAHLLFALALGALWWANRRSGRSFEGATAGETAASWHEAEAVTDAAFFGHAASYGRLRLRHELLAVAGAVAVVLLGFVERHPVGAAPDTSLSSIGLAIVVLAAVQGVLLVLLWLTCPWLGSVPQAVLATIGTVLCHAAFAGLGITAVERLSRWPKLEGSPRPVIAGPELGFADFFFVALAAAVLLCAIFSAVTARRRRAIGYPPAAPPKLPTALVARATTFGALIALSFVGALVLLVALQLGDVELGGPSTWWGSVIDWYEGYEAAQNAAQKLGGLALVGIALAFVAVLRRPRDGTFARILGNVWDVLTFWPRRFHPFAVPPYAERAVPELRLVVRASREAGRTVVLAGHSQGSVLSFAAAAQELAARPGQGPISFLSFGSPLGTLYDQAFPAYFGDRTRRAVAATIAGAGGRWWNLYRSTDPISGPVGAGGATTGEWFDKWLPDPRGVAVPNPFPLPPPLERSRPPYAEDGHNFYLADPVTRELRDRLRDPSAVSAAALAGLRDPNAATEL
jgi:hypothetical protein